MGGKGGVVTVAVVSSRRDFHHLGHVVEIQGHPGGNGGPNGRTGRDGLALTIEVPLGTAVMEEAEDGEHVLLADLAKSGSALVVAQGGVGGKGNTGFATATNQTPVLAEAGAR